jgi:energy-coupling factor transporter ATP-binding protein EcfA2
VVSSCATERPFSVQTEGLAVAPPGSDSPLLTRVDLGLRAGECAVLTGPTGSGKSTLLRAIAGIPASGGRLTGRIAIEGRPALLFQNVETQLLFTTVDEEVASGPLHAGAAPEQVRRRTARALAQVGLEGFERRAVDALSAGEKQRVVLAALLALEPALLLLDEPTSALDEGARERLVEVLAELRRRGHAIIVADHVLEPFRQLADRWWLLAEGRLTEVATCPPEARVPASPPPPLEHPERDAVRCEDLAVCDASGRTLLRAVSLRVRRGERVLVSGPNGSGKTTLLRAIAGLLPPSAGRVCRAPASSPGDPAWWRGIGLLFQSPQRNLFERTVAEEVAFALRRMGRPPAAVRQRVEQVLELCALARQRDRSPLRLSFGEQHRVALASVLAPEPELLLLDEPFSGLDSEARVRLLEVLAREQDRLGSALLFAVHDEKPLRGWAHRCVRLEAGRMRDA